MQKSLLISNSNSIFNFTVLFIYYSFKVLVSQHHANNCATLTKQLIEIPLTY